MNVNGDQASTNFIVRAERLCDQVRVDELARLIEPRSMLAPEMEFLPKEADDCADGGCDTARTLLLIYSPSRLLLVISAHGRDVLFPESESDHNGEE
jgi:hypothetical protein